MIIFGDPISQSLIEIALVERLKNDIKVILQDNFATHNPWECDVHTTYDLFNLFDNRRFNWLKIIILEKINNFFLEQNIQSINLTDYELVGWLNFYNKGQFQEMHNHSGSETHISGSMIVNCADDFKNAGSFVFYNTKTTNIKYSRLFTNNSHQHLAERWVIDPKPGEILIFPSYLPHFVTQNKTNITRISLSFNLKYINRNV